MKVKQSEPDWVEAVSRNAKVDRRGTRRGGATAGGSAGTRVRAIDRQEPPSPHLDAINHSCCALPVGSMMVARKATTKPCGGRERSGSVITALTQAKREATVRMKVADRGRSPCRRSMSITSNCDAFSVTPPHCFVGRPSRTPPRRGFYGTSSMTMTSRSLRRIVRRCLRTAARFRRVFALRAPHAPNLVVLGADVDPSALGSGSGPVGHVAGTGLNFRQAFEALRRGGSGIRVPVRDG